MEVTASDATDDLLLAAPLRVVAAAVAPVLDNAVRHAVARGAACGSPPDRGRCWCTSRTTGTGWPPTHRDRIFEPGHSTEPDGSGLGLALARRLAHSVGGEVDQRDGGHGHFVLTFPRG